MAFGLAKPRLSPIGLDFGADTLKLLQLEHADGTTNLIAAASESVPEAARQDRSSRLTFLNETLPRLLKAAPFKGRRVALGMPAFETLVLNFAVPCGESDDPTPQSNVYLQTEMNLDPARLVSRHMSLSSCSLNNKAHKRMLCMAAARESVMGYLQVAESQKLEISGIHPEPIAITRAMSHSPIWSDPSATVAVIDLGALTTKIALVREGQMVLARSAVVGMEMAVDVLSRSERSDASTVRERIRTGQASDMWSLTQTEAEGGVALLDPEAETPSAASSGSNRMESIDDMVEMLVDEIAMTRRYQRRLAPDHPVAGLVFVGGGAMALELCTAIAQRVELPAKLGHPMQGMWRRSASHAPDPQTPQPAWTVCTGLCLMDGPE